MKMKEKKAKDTTKNTEKKSTKTTVIDKRPLIIKEKNNKKTIAEKDKKLLNIAFNILAVFCIAIFCFSLTPKTFQNDTFYTIKVGQGIREWGIDGQDHYSFIDLPYTYPHWLYDVIMSLIYDFMGGFTGL